MALIPDCCFPPFDSANECEQYAEAIAEIERLRAALLWLDRYDPELVAAAETRFGFKLSGDTCPGNQ